MKKGFYVFTGDKGVFVHTLLNAIDLHEKGKGGKILLESAAVKMPKEMADHPIYKKAVELDLIMGICEKCSEMMGVLEYNEGTNIPIIGSLEGHIPMNLLIEEGYEIITI